MHKNKLEQIGKIDLHCHLDGSLTLGSIQQILGRTVKMEELQVARDCRDLAQYLEKFNLPLQCLQTAQGLKNASREFIIETAKEHTRYIEVRFAPLLSANEHLNCEQVMEAVIAGLEEGKQISGVEYNTIACAMRQHTIEESKKMMHSVRAFLGKGLCAVDLAGNEAAYPMKDFMDLFAYAKSLELPFTIHAGECGNADNIVDAIEAGAGRIGHGIAMQGHPDILALCKEKKIGVEMCPTSNLQTKAVLREEAYPIREFMNAGVLVTVNTDNRTVSNTTMMQEWDWLVEKHQFSEEELLILTRNAVEVSFASGELKDKLHKSILK